jgi:HK97 gp10 family phage protein
MATIEIKGLDDVIKKLSKVSDNAVEEVGRVAKINAQEIEANAKRDAPKDKGKLGQSIITTEVEETLYSVGTREPYAPFVEFGTRSKVDVPKGFEDVAMAFKGKKINSGGYEEFKKWALRKGIPEQYVFATWLKVLRVGQNPQPYLIPNFLKQKPQFIKDLKTLLKRLVK